jgi:hypothetical protein
MESLIPSTLSQQLPRDTIPKWANSDGETFLPDGVTFSSISAPRIRPHGAVASSLEWTTAAMCMVLKTSVIGSTLTSYFGRIDKRLGLLSSSSPPCRKSTPVKFDEQRRSKGAHEQEEHYVSW